MYLYLVLLWLLVAYSGAGHSAEIHKWVDKDGNVHYSDSPPSDVVTELIKPQPAPSKDDIRRTQATTDLLIEQQRVSADQRAQEHQEKRLQKADSQVTAIEEERVCLDARMQLVVLKAREPVYRDDQGKWRARWRYDSYNGERIYLDDADRPTALTRARKNMEVHCVVDPQAQDFARTRWILSERCAAAKADLEFLERPDARNWNPKTQFEKQRRLVQLYCEE